MNALKSAATTTTDGLFDKFLQSLNGGNMILNEHYAYIPLHPSAVLVRDVSISKKKVRDANECFIGIHRPSLV